MNGIMTRPMTVTDNKMIDCRFANLGSPDRIFAIPSIHGDLNKLHRVHENIYNQFRAGDRIIYLGNYTGYGHHSRQTIDALLNFRRFLLCIPGVQPTDITYLRGTQEEMWQKLLQIQFAPNPPQILDWMLSQGLAQTMESYGVDLMEAKRVVYEGVIRLSRWTDSVRQKVYNNPGHDIFGAQLKRAAYTDCAMTQTHGVCSPMLFVNAGIDYTKSLEDQGDCFWWGTPHFKSMHSPYGKYQRIVRGFDPLSEGVDVGNITATLDSNCGRGGDLVFAEIAGSGEILDIRAA
jgi:hypothetical protein